jgi:hypothetical protein
MKTEKEAGATGLNIILKISRRDNGTDIITTESGHGFALPKNHAPEEENEFTIDSVRLSDETLDECRPAMARALLNEIIRAPADAAALDTTNA